MQNIMSQPNIWLDLAIIAVVGLLIYAYFAMKNRKEAASGLGVAASSETVEKNQTEVSTTSKNAKIAAVMAAVQAMMGDSSYRVISIKPAPSDWKQAVNYKQDFTNRGRK